jgi:hypothetical protein
MESAVEVPADMVTMLPGNGRGKVRLLTRQSLDGRTKGRKQFDAIADSIADDLKGSGKLSTIQLHLIEAFAGCALIINAINARLLSGQAIDITEHSQAASTLVRLASRLGLHRRMRDAGDLIDHVARIEAEKADSEQADEAVP